MKKKQKRRLMGYTIIVLFFLLLATIVSIAAIWIKYKIIDYEAANRPSEKISGICYYNALNYRDQILYNTIIQSAESFSEETEVIEYSYNMEDFQRIIKYIRADRPDLFYVDFNELILYHSKRKTKVGMIYIDTKQACSTMKTEYEAALDNALSVITTEMTEFQKELALNDYLTDICSYAIGENDSLANTAYGALVTKSAFCDGYAYAMKSLLNAAGIDSAVIYGTAKEVDHVWNIVSIDMNYYHLDTMWNDADLGSELPLRFHGYFNLCDNDISIDHTFENPEGIIPAANTCKCYYKQSGCYAEKIEELEDIFYNNLLEAVNNNRQYIELKCPETKDNTVLSDPFNRALERVNQSLGYDALFGAFRVYEASEVSNAVTIQIFYN